MGLCQINKFSVLLKWKRYFSFVPSTTLHSYTVMVFARFLTTFFYFSASTVLMMKEVAYCFALIAFALDNGLTGDLPVWEAQNDVLLLWPTFAWLKPVTTLLVLPVTGAMSLFLERHFLLEELAILLTANDCFVICCTKLVLRIWGGFTVLFAMLIEPDWANWATLALDYLLFSSFFCLLCIG